ncbi:MAG: DUF58 domain-containing protein [Betaproteobacteria bacterium]|nr:DUF58 domain-containing protein [Betaproteobacteria bacterium]NBY72166.1 DUF58 domain-containing protein [Betaproteobacteria bacterium]NDD12900.1 DUF58 domain-containing protein [Betaproteobacteria bacterium]
MSAEALLQHLEWTVIRRLDGLLQGNHRTLFRGSGLELADLREYQAQDDVRHIDWNVTARMQTPFVREHQEDREINAWFLLDLSGSMDFGSSDVTKRNVMLRFVSVMAKLLMNRGNRIGALVLNPTEPEGFKYIPARMHRRHLLHLLHVLETSTVSQQPHQTRLTDWLRKANDLFKRRSSVFVVSDFMGAFNWTTELSALGQRHDTVAVRLFDPAEVSLPNAGLVLLQDSETSEQLLLDTANQRFRTLYAQAVEKREQQLADSFAYAGVDALELSTDEDLASALIRFSELRKRRVWRA